MWGIFLLAIIVIGSALPRKGMDQWIEGIILIIIMLILAIILGGRRLALRQYGREIWILTNVWRSWRPMVLSILGGLLCAGALWFTVVDTRARSAARCSPLKAIPTILDRHGWVCLPRPPEAFLAALPEEDGEPSSMPSWSSSPWPSSYGASFLRDGLTARE